MSTHSGRINKQIAFICQEFPVGSGIDPALGRVHRRDRTLRPVRKKSERQMVQKGLCYYFTYATISIKIHLCY